MGPERFTREGSSLCPGLEGGRAGGGERPACEARVGSLSWVALEGPTRWGGGCVWRPCSLSGRGLPKAQIQRKDRGVPLPSPPRPFRAARIRRGGPEWGGTRGWGLGADSTLAGRDLGDGPTCPLLGRERGTPPGRRPGFGSSEHPGGCLTLPVPPSPSWSLHPPPQARAWILPPCLTLHRPWSEPQA